jgi:hypothetical protein
MNGATNSEVSWELWMAMVFGASSPKTTCKKEMIENPTTKAIKCRVPPSIPSGSSRGSIRAATAGSPKAPRPREEIVIPSWQTAR